MERIEQWFVDEDAAREALEYMLEDFGKARIEQAEDGRWCVSRRADCDAVQGSPTTRTCGGAE